jgi:hypothetical protein
MDAEYLKGTVAEGLSKGLAATVAAQPDDAVEFLGQYLLKHVENMKAAAEVRGGVIVLVP